MHVELNGMPDIDEGELERQEAAANANRSLAEDARAEEDDCVANFLRPCDPRLPSSLRDESDVEKHAGGRVSKVRPKNGKGAMKKEKNSKTRKYR